MKNLSKMLRGSCAIVTSGTLVFSTLPAMAQAMGQDQPPPGVQLPPPDAAQQPPQPAGPQLGQGELEKLVAPIALYPDDLVAQILTASTYPIEVVEAERWVSAHPNVHGDPLQDAMQQQPWDASVKGLTAVPQVLSMMNDKLDWTQQLGEAFLAQPDDVSNAIQQLRSKAQANGNLRSSDRIRVSTVAPPEPPPQRGINRQATAYSCREVNETAVVTKRPVSEQTRQQGQGVLGEGRVNKRLLAFQCLN